LTDRDWILIGRTAGVFGLRGDIKLEPLTDFPERFKTLDVIHLGPGREEWTVERTRPHGKHVLLKLRGVDDADAASELRGREAFVPRTEAMPLPAGHYLLEDLVGVDVATADGKKVGTVADVLRTGSNDVYVVRTARGEVLVPGIRDAVLELDLSARRMVIDPWVLEPPV
jgi:16S rRNA processing protein RimM